MMKLLAMASILSGVGSAWVLPTSKPFMADTRYACNIAQKQQRIHPGNVLNLSADDANTEESLDLESLMEMDCFVYSRTDDNTKMELGVLEESVLQPICAWTMEEAFDDYIEFVVDEEDRYSVDAKDVTIHSLIDADSLSYGSRQVGGGKGPGNPHGEESEILYYIHKDSLEGLEVTIKPELEILW